MFQVQCTRHSYAAAWRGEQYRFQLVYLRGRRFKLGGKLTQFLSYKISFLEALVLRTVQDYFSCTRLASSREMIPSRKISKLTFCQQHQLAEMIYTRRGRGRGIATGSAGRVLLATLQRHPQGQPAAWTLRNEVGVDSGDSTQGPEDIRSSLLPPCSPTKENVQSKQRK
ncbi:hypothetical protein I3842_13G087200 [Carya illinoinensis]|uniref:Uncharacterized protein n=1 Tax=Carya illinoinensis TaxID=32201 RepID=A0A922AHB3_CARIL|nr:hypothetical protein I3842_13G087200 [Carya illinoinensis]